MAKTKKGLRFCTEHTGKMEGMISLSTACSTNPLCIKNASIPGSICSKCYAQTMLKIYDGLQQECQHNTAILTTGVIPWDELPFINARFFRFEAFGDVGSETQLINYINIAKKNPHCRFTLWTKNYSLVDSYFTTHRAPNNFTLIISSLKINVPNIRLFEAIQKLGTIKNLKLFTVYDADTAIAQKININCGGRKCIDCLQCYRVGETDVIINEMLKSDKSKYERYEQSLTSAAATTKD